MATTAIIVIEKYKKLKNNKGNNIRGSLKESPGIEAWYAKREALSRKEGDGNGNTRERRRRRRPLREDGWLEGMISKRMDCQVMKCTTVLHGGEYHQI